MQISLKTISNYHRVMQIWPISGSFSAQFTHVWNLHLAHYNMCLISNLLSPLSLIIHQKDPLNLAFVVGSFNGLVWKLKKIHMEPFNNYFKGDFTHRRRNPWRVIYYTRNTGIPNTGRYMENAWVVIEGVSTNGLPLLSL